MKFVRFVLGKIIIALDTLFSPKAVVRTTQQQERVNAVTKNFVLYHMVGCPFCVKVRRHMRKLNLSFDMRDIVASEQFKNELIAGGGEYQAPCLRIGLPNGSFQWMYESSDINAYLDRISQERSV